MMRRSYCRGAWRSWRIPPWAWEWGCRGSEPTQLALAILLAVLGRGDGRQALPAVQGMLRGAAAGRPRGWLELAVAIRRPILPYEK